MIGEQGEELGFVWRHLGPRPREIREMLDELGATSVEEVVDRAVPPAIRTSGPLQLGDACSEHQMLAELAGLAGANQIWRSYLGMGYSDCLTPAVIQRNVLENPGWYTQYTPYQAEIAQGRLEALLNFQTMVIDLTGFEVANASLLDEATAAAEAMGMLGALAKGPGRVFFVAADCHPQTLAVVRTRAEYRGWEVVVGDPSAFEFDDTVFGALIQYPTTEGALRDYRAFCAAAHLCGARVVVAADLLALTLLTPPAEFGADVAVGSTQRLGMPMGYGGPHAAYFATREQFKRQLPGRIIGVSQDSQGRPALRMALQTREQHIRREKATSNICTAQVLPAVVASMYAVYHGPAGLRAIAARIHRLACQLGTGLVRHGHRLRHAGFFDTLFVEPAAGTGEAIAERARARRLNLRVYPDGGLGISLDETTTAEDVAILLEVIGGPPGPEQPSSDLELFAVWPWAPCHHRSSPYLQHPVFNSYHAETEMLRYLRRLEARDLSLNVSMIPLGSCTMKLNAAAEMMPITWPAFASLHPFAPREQAEGYTRLFADLEAMLAEITGLAALSLQPNAGSQGEYTGLLVVRRYHEARGEGQRDLCLIPASAHGTNPASAVLAGLEVVVVRCDEAGNIDLDDLRQKAEQHRERLAVLMVTYPSTHGVYEEGIGELCRVVHAAGGQVSMDGANMTALVGLCRPGDLGVDVCHLNLHKTFCIPHGGGGPGMGPIAVATHLAPFLPSHPVIPTGGSQALGPVAAAPWSSALILVIPWAYIKMMGGEGLTTATEVAILNANYLAKRLDPFFPVLYKGRNGMVAHEAILDLRRYKSAGIEVEDVAKRLMDSGYHAPTVSFPVPGTLMVEPTESESKAELDRFCAALIAIHAEMEEVVSGRAHPQDNLLKNAPHTAEMVTAEVWAHPYTRQQAALPAPWSRDNKFWPAVARLNNAQGDRNLICACPPVAAYGKPAKGEE
ncbi:MAG: aminomethyl-transferring glycine dehydrogenase [Candidatus Latescibacteria bacterium]|nr:aminomethyl-transferring glycine dehydrogenase [Candidatus Latescibacterota bacterium]